MDGLSIDILKSRDPKFKEISSQIAYDIQYMPHFKVIIHRFCCSLYSIVKIKNLIKILFQFFHIRIALELLMALI